MNSHIQLPVLLLTLASVLMCGLSNQNEKTDPCMQVSIQVKNPSFESAAFVRGVLQTNGPATIYYWPRSFRAQRHSGEEGWLPSKLPWTKSDYHKTRPARFNFKKPSLVGIDWQEVESKSQAGEIIVPSGKYRLLLQFTLSDTVGEDTQWCVIESQDFALEESVRVFDTN